jgi:uncharacterized protein (DUF488 family)
MAESGTSKALPDPGRPPRNDVPELFSIGHSNVTAAAFLDLLRRHRIEVVADVRSFPRSQFVPHFDAKPLERSLVDAGIRYVALGEQLGGRPDGDEFYDSAGYVMYDGVARSAPFVAGIQRLLRGVEQFRVVMLCSEEDPVHCHRRLLIGRVLASQGAEVSHIRHNGTIQTEDDLARTGQAEAHPAQPLLFQPAVEEQPWRSSRSVSRRRAQRSSSAP